MPVNHLQMFHGAHPVHTYKKCSKCHIMQRSHVSLCKGCEFNTYCMSLDASNSFHISHDRFVVERMPGRRLARPSTTVQGGKNRTFGSRAENRYRLRGPGCVCLDAISRRRTQELRRCCDGFSQFSHAERISMLYISRFTTATPAFLSRTALRSQASAERLLPLFLCSRSFACRRRSTAKGVRWARWSSEQTSMAL